jgi:hypothetical protein
MIWWIQSCDEKALQGFGCEIQRDLLLDSACKADWSDNESDVLRKQYLSLGLVELEHTQSDDDDESDSCTDDSEEKAVQLIQCLNIEKD